jgi:hypothetical protein
MDLGHYSHFAQIVLQVAAKDLTPPSPSEVVDWADDGILYDKVIERANAVGVDPSAFESLTDRSGFAEQAARWANVIDTERKYGLASDGAHGWLALIWFYVDLVRQDAA